MAATSAVFELGHTFLPAKELGLVGWNHLVCKDCGIVRPKGGAVNKCRGKVKVTTRDNDREEDD